MTNDAQPAIPSTMRQIRTLVTADGQLELSIAEVDVPVPGPGEVLVRIEATPINPSDLGLLLAAADISRAVATGSPESPVVTAPISAAVMHGLGGRIGESMAVGNEG